MYSLILNKWEEGSGFSYETILEVLDDNDIDYFDLSEAASEWELESGDKLVLTDSNDCIIDSLVLE